ncbi:hypothetical protein Q1695_006548 [Nippostrongylus brasiliensis]|nr:hypothetical protein Q1695_006548 [Nippostrongylus brasiliensis]
MLSSKGYHLIVHSMHGGGLQICPPRVISCLTNAILDGNILHEEALERRLSDEQNFTIPDAIRACKNAFMEVDFCTVPGPLSIELPFYLQAVIKSKELSRDPRLFFLLIAFERTVLIVYERATSSMTLFDSHMHGHSDGAVIATGHVDNLTDLCEWLSYNIFHESQELDEDYNREFEISLIRFCGSTSSGDCCLPQATPPCEFPVFDATRWRRKRRLDTKTAIRILKHARADRRPKTDVLSKGSRQQTSVPLASLTSLRSRGF